MPDPPYVLLLSAAPPVDPLPFGPFVAMPEFASPIVITPAAKMPHPFGLMNVLLVIVRFWPPSATLPVPDISVMATLPL